MIKKPLKRGFTLIEMAIVITILGLIMYSTLKFGSAAMDATKISTTKTKLAAIKEATQLYYETKSGAADALGYLPCPADATLVSTNASFGVESTHADGTNGCTGTTTVNFSGSAGLLKDAATATIYIGSVPTRTLGLPDDYAYDGWGNRITYAVSKQCTKTFAASVSAPCTGPLTIVDTSGNTVSARAAYVLVSHGKNGTGAWPRNGGTSRNAATCPTSTSELDNANMAGGCAALSATPATSFFQFRDGTINDGTVAANYFDDVAVWVTDQMMYYIRTCKLSGAGC